MSDKCDHANFNEYFGRCDDCNASREQVIKENLTNELQEVYTKILEVMGIGGGWLDHSEYPEMAKAQDVFTTKAAKWIDHLYETVE